MGTKKMSEYKPNKMEQEILTSVKSISISLKEIKEQLLTKNKIDSVNLCFNLASNETFKKLSDDEITKLMPKINSTLKAVSKNLYDS